MNRSISDQLLLGSRRRSPGYAGVSHLPTPRTAPTPRAHGSSDPPQQSPHRTTSLAGPADSINLTVLCTTRHPRPRRGCRNRKHCGEAFSLPRRLEIWEGPERKMLEKKGKQTTEIQKRQVPVYSKKQMQKEAT